jgi:hypothetical protein
MKDAPDNKISLVGPFSEEYHRATIAGYEIPNLKFLRRSGANDGLATVLLDNRFAIDVPEDQLDPWLWIVANAMAISAGFSCHGENSTKDWNPYRRKLIGLEQI